MISKLNAALTGQVLSASLAIFSNSSDEIPSTSAYTGACCPPNSGHNLGYHVCLSAAIAWHSVR